MEKIKLLYNKKPVPASKKTVSDVLQGERLEKGKTVDMGVMIIGGAPDPPARASAVSGGADVPRAGKETPAPLSETTETTEKVSSPPPVQGPSGTAILATEEFWTDLQGYLEQRVKDEAQALRLVQKWKSNWNVD